jgi:hypothetical protein
MQHRTIYINIVIDNWDDVFDEALYIYVRVFWISIIKHNCKKDDDLMTYIFF